MNLLPTGVGGFISPLSVLGDGRQGSSLHVAPNETKDAFIVRRLSHMDEHAKSQPRGSIQRKSWANSTWHVFGGRSKIIIRNMLRY